MQSTAVEHFPNENSPPGEIGDAESRLHVRRLPQIIFYLIVCAIPYYQLRQISDALPFLKIDWLLMGMLLAIVVPTLVLDRRNIPDALKSNLWRWLGLFLLINLIAGLVSPYTGHALASLINPLLFSYIFIGINLIMLDRQGFERYLPIVLAWSIGINAFLGCLEYFGGMPPVSGVMAERGRGFTIGANNMALMGVFTIPLLLHWILYARNHKSKTAGVLLLIINIGGVISSASRGGFLSMLLVGGLALLSLRHRFEPRYFGLVMAGFGLAALLAIMFVPEDYIQRQSTILEGTSADKSTRRRTAYLKVGWAAFTDNPLLGTGVDTFRKHWIESEQTRRFDLIERPAHNTYMEVLVGSGVVGFTIFMLLLGQAFLNFTRARRLFTQAGRDDLASLTAAYRLSLLSVCVYFVFKSGLDHKLFLLALPLSQVALTLGRRQLQTGEGRDNT